jgi:predicted ester cyclase
MSAAANKELIREYLNALSGNPKPLTVVEQFVSDPALIEHIALCEAAFPRYEIAVHQVVAEDDLVTVRGTFKGTHRGASFFGVEPRGVEASGGLIIIYRIANGRIAEHWLQFDAASVMAQLQNAPAAATA